MSDASAQPVVASVAIMLPGSNSIWLVGGGGQKASSMGEASPAPHKQSQPVKSLKRSKITIRTHWAVAVVWLLTAEQPRTVSQGEASEEEANRRGRRGCVPCFFLFVHDVITGSSFKKCFGLCFLLVVRPNHFAYLGCPTIYFGLYFL